MADDDEWFDYGSLDEDEQRFFIYEQIGFTHDPVDQTAHDLFYQVMYDDTISQDTRMDLYEALSLHMWDEYGIVFSEIWDWEDFRNWYDSQ